MALTSLVFLLMISSTVLSLTVVHPDPGERTNHRGQRRSSSSSPTGNGTHFADVIEFIGRFVPISEDISNEVCRQHSLAYLSGIQNLQPWALKMLDSSSKLQSGLLDGNIKNLGQYDECVGVLAPPTSPSSSPSFSGQYCLANVEVSSESDSPRHLPVEQLIDTMTLGRRSREMIRNRTVQNAPGPVPSLALIQWAVCVPSSCSPRDVQITLDRALADLAEQAGLRASVEVFPESCTVLASRPWTSTDLTMLVMIGVVLSLVAASSTYDLLRPEGLVKSGGGVERALRSFSLPANWGRLFSLQQPPAGQAISSLGGIRVINTLWVVMTHKLQYFVQQPLTNKYKVVESVASIWKMPLINGLVNVDTFFLLSGLLKAYHDLHSLELGRFSMVSSISRRYLRLTPAYAVMVGIYASLLVHLSSGPAWTRHMQEQLETCSNHWIYNMLYINNYLDCKRWCMQQTWYLAVDMQLFLLSPLIVYPLWRWPRLGRVLLAGATVVSIAVPLVITFVTRGLPTIVISASDAELMDYTSRFYGATHNRMAPYVVGLGLGYLLYQLKGSHLQLRKLQVMGGWVASVALMLVVLVGPYKLMQYHYQYNILEVTLMAGLHRFTWALGMAWVVFACHLGYGGWVDRFMSARIFLPLSRLSYCMFLTHFALFMANNASLRNAAYVDDFVLIHGFLGDVCLTLVFSVVLYLLVEAPIFELSEVYYARGKSAPKVSSTSCATQNHVDVARDGGKLKKFR